MTPTNWDAHQDLDVNHRHNAQDVDKPIAGLLADLQSRGLLESTLVVWTSEFGRTSYGQSGNGRDHNPWGYTQWLAGGGVKAGTTYGQPTRSGCRSVGKGWTPTTCTRQCCTYWVWTTCGRCTSNNGRAERPTVVYGKVVKELLA